MIYVDTSEWQVHYEHDGEEYGNWSAEYDFQVNSIHKSKSNTYREAINVCFDYEVGDTLYVLWMRYGEGDSFGHGSGKGEVLWVFREKILAEKAVEAFHNVRSECQVKVWDECLNELYLNNPATDYFSSQEDVCFEAFEVLP